MGAAAAGPPRLHPRLRPAALYILPPGTGRDFYSGRAPLPPPFGAGPAGQTDGRTDLLPKHNSTSSPERRTSTRRINATLDRTRSVGWCVQGWTRTAGGAGHVAGWGRDGQAQARLREWQAACSHRPGGGTLLPFARVHFVSRVCVPFCKSFFTSPRGTPPPQSKTKQLPFLPGAGKPPLCRSSGLLHEARPSSGRF